MPSTYSQLKIELIGTGDQAGTWGTTTNTNLGTAVEEAITGNATVTFASSNAAIALSDTNAAQTARNLRLILGGTISTTQTLFVPAITKQYLITNNLSNPVVISNGSNASPTGTTVTVPAGRSMSVFNNGTSITETVTYVTELNTSNVTAINVTATGNVTGANVTATSLVRSVNVTATGNVSAANLAATALITTANLTATSTINAATLNLTNALGVASGGTGQATLTANNVLLGNGTSAVNFVAPGTSGNVLTSNGTVWLSQAPAASGITTGKSIAMAMIFGF